MSWRVRQPALRRYLRTAYDARLQAALDREQPDLEALAAAHETAKRHALATAEGRFATGRSGPVRTTRRTDRAVARLLERAARAHDVEAEALRAVRDRRQAEIRSTFLGVPIRQQRPHH